MNHSEYNTNNKGLQPLVQEPLVQNRGGQSIFHITWVTHNSRISERMVQYKVQKGEGIYLSDDQELAITRYIGDIVRENHFQILTYNICKDHVHILLICKEEKLPDIIRKLKGKSAQKFKEWLGVGKNEIYHLWAQKYNISYIENDEKFQEVMRYIEYNRVKHGLSDNKGLQPLVHEFLTVYDDELLKPSNNKG